MSEQQTNTELEQTNTELEQTNARKSKLTDRDIKYIFYLRNTGLLQREIAQQMGVSQSYVGRILRGVNPLEPEKKYQKNDYSEEIKKRQSQARQGKLVGEKNPRCKLTNQQIGEIREWGRSSDLTQKDIALMYNTSQTNVSAILLGKSRKDMPVDSSLRRRFVNKKKA